MRGTVDVATPSGVPGVEGSVGGTALYEGRTTLEELLRVAQTDGRRR